MPPFTTAALPPYRAIFVVDAKDFTRNPSRSHAEIAVEIPQLVEASFRRAGLQTAWSEVWRSSHTGDGIALLLDPEHLPHLVDPLLAALQVELHTRNRSTPRHEPHLRLRASLHVGPVSDSGRDSVGDGNGAARNDAHRLLDSAPVRRMLTDSSDRVTALAALLSDRVYEDVVLGGYTELDPDEFVHVSATVAGKVFASTGWLFVPRPSGSLLRTGLGDPRRADEPNDHGATATARSSYPGTNYGQVIGRVDGGNTQNVHGGRP